MENNITLFTYTFYVTNTELDRGKIILRGNIDLGYNMWKSNAKIELAGINVLKYEGKVKIADYVNSIVKNKTVILNSTQDKTGIIFYPSEEEENKWIELNSHLVEADIAQPNDYEK